MLFHITTETIMSETANVYVSTFFCTGWMCVYEQLCVSMCVGKIVWGDRDLFSEVAMYCKSQKRSHDKP